MPLALLAPWSVAAQDQSVAPGINASFENPNVEEFVGRFERDGRDPYDHRQRVLEAMRLRPGMVVADIGAGTGLFTRLFAPLVAPGTVYAVDIAPAFVDHITATARQERLTNVSGVVCRQDSVNLSPASIDLAFICDVYHHFEYPLKTMRSLHRALRPGGQVVLIDFERIEGKSSEFVLGHVRAGKEVFRSEIEAAGFTLAEEVPGMLTESYFLRFMKKEAGTVSPGQSDAIRATTHTIESPYQDATVDIRVLAPDRLEAGAKYPALYVLPVEPGRGERFGDGLAEIKRLDLHNKFGLICVAPSFSRMPFYCDHATDTRQWHESHFLDVVLPFVERTYPVASDRENRLLLGFSKSGVGAVVLALRHSEIFGRAAAFDAPLAAYKPTTPVWEEAFGSHELFDEYRATSLLSRRVNEGRLPSRLVLSGYDIIGGSVEAFYRHARSLGLPNDSTQIIHHPGPRRAHRWDSGWVAEAVEGLVAE